MRILVNADWVGTDLPAGTPLLELLREDCRLTAAKPGCGTGDCGSCVVLLGRRRPDGQLSHLPVNSCLVPLAYAEGCQVITLEGTNRPGSLTPIQSALLSARAVQCGYCTPGLVMALTGGLMSGTDAAAVASGSLCRCTGYQPIRRACAALAARIPTAGMDLHRAAELGLVRREVADACASLTAPVPSSPGAPGTVIGGATDWTPGHPPDGRPSGPLAVTGRMPQLCGIHPAPGGVEIGAATTVAELAEDPLMSARWPTLAEHLRLFACPSIRNLATVGGNLANASPAADLAVLLLAMQARVELFGPDGARQLPLAGFHLGHRATALRPAELIRSVVVPDPPPGSTLQLDKVARRGLDDVATVSLASLAVGDHRLRYLALAAGGVGPKPLLLAETVRQLTAVPLEPRTIIGARAAMDAEIAPRDDVHGSAGYRRRLLHHLLVAHLARLDPELEVASCLA